MPTDALTRTMFSRVTRWLTLALLVLAVLNLLPATSLAAGVTTPQDHNMTAVVPYHADLYPPRMLLLLLDDGQLEAYDPLRHEAERFLWRANTTPPHPLGHRRTEKGRLRPRESMTVTPSLARAAVDPLALPFIVRGNRLFTRLPLWDSADLSTRTEKAPLSSHTGTSSTPYRTEFYRGNTIDSSLPEEVRAHFFMNVSSLIRRQTVQVHGTDIYVTTAVTFDDIDSFSGRVVHGSGAGHGSWAGTSTIRDAPNAGATAPTVAVFPRLHLAQHTVTIHAYRPGEYQWSIELPSVDLSERTVLDTDLSADLIADLASSPLDEDVAATRASGTARRGRFARLASVIESLRGAVRAPGSLHSLQSRDGECEPHAQSTSSPTCTTSQYPATPDTMVVSQDAEGVVKTHQINPKTGELVMAALCTPTSKSHAAAVAAAFLYTPQQPRGHTVQRVPLFYTDTSAAVAAYLDGHSSSSSSSTQLDEAALSRGAPGLLPLPVPPFLSDKPWESDVRSLQRFNEGFRDVDLDAEDVEGTVLEHVFSAYGPNVLGGDAAILYRRMTMTSTELAKELSFPSTGLAPPAPYKFLWRLGVLIMMHVAALAGSLGCYVSGISSRDQLLTAWHQSDHYRHRPGATPKFGHRVHPLQTHDGLLNRDFLLAATDSQDLTSPSPGESFETLPTSLQSRTGSPAMGSPAMDTPHQSGPTTGMARAARWSAVAPSSSESSEDDSDSSDSDTDSEDDSALATRTTSLGSVSWDPAVTSPPDALVRSRSARNQTAPHHTEPASLTRRTSKASIGSDAAATASADGRLFQEHFRIISRIGVGGEGCVLCVEHRVTHVKYAVKAVRIQPQDEQRVVQEAVLHSSFDNPHVVRFYFCWIQNVAMNERAALRLRDVGGDFEECQSDLSSTQQQGLRLTDEDDDDDDTDSVDTHSSASLADETFRMLFIQMEYFSCGTLADELAQRACFYRIDNLQYIKQICEGLWYLHDADVVHRDLKPTNIFLSLGNQLKRQSALVNGTGGQDVESRPTTAYPATRKTLKIGDFGLAKQRRNPNPATTELAGNVAGGLAEKSIVGGTPLYSSPEQLDGRAAGKPSDIFSLGIIAVELYCLFTTYHERSRVLTEARNQHLPEDLVRQFPQEAKLIMAMLSPYPNRRPDAPSILAQVEALIEKEEALNRQTSLSLQAPAAPIMLSTFPDAPLTPASAASPPKLWTGMLPLVGSNGQLLSPPPAPEDTSPLPSVETTRASSRPPTSSTLPAPTSTVQPPLASSAQTLLMSPPSNQGSPHSLTTLSGPLAVLSPVDSAVTANSSSTQSRNQFPMRPAEWADQWQSNATDRSNVHSPSSVVSAPLPSSQPPSKPRGTLFYRPARGSVSVSLASVGASTDEDHSVYLSHSTTTPPRLDTAALSGWSRAPLGARCLSMNALDDWAENGSASYGSAAYGIHRDAVSYSDDPDLSAALRDGLRDRRGFQAAVDKM